LINADSLEEKINEERKEKGGLTGAVEKVEEGSIEEDFEELFASEADGAKQQSAD